MSKTKCQSASSYETHGRLPCLLAPIMLDTFMIIYTLSAMWLPEVAHGNGGDTMNSAAVSNRNAPLFNTFHSQFFWFVSPITDFCLTMPFQWPTRNHPGHELQNDAVLFGGHLHCKQKLWNFPLFLSLAVLFSPYPSLHPHLYIYKNSMTYIWFPSS